jgi:uncharacterized membrane protein YhaH (DUF805 family)
VRKLGYWIVVFMLAVLTVAAFRYTAIHGRSTEGLLGLFATLVSFAVLLSFGLSMRDREDRTPPIAR